jgi:hypothetical protein
MYCDGPLFQPQGEDLEKLSQPPGTSSSGLSSACLLLARRQALARLHPLQQSSLAVADRPTNPDVGRAVAAHARLGEPGDADLEKLGRLLGREQYDGRRGRFLRRRASGKRRLRGHFRSRLAMMRIEAQRPGVSRAVIRTIS